MDSWADVIGNGINRSRILRLLETFEHDGARVDVPTAKKRDDYVNVRPAPGSRRRGRICSINVHTGRVEFQIHSWDRLIEQTGFDHLASGNKAARTPNTDADLDAIVAAFRNEIAKTR